MATNLSIKSMAGLLVAGLLLAAGPAVADDDNRRSGQTFQAVDVFTVPPTDPLTLTGAAWLKRSKQGLSGRIMTKVARAGYAYTVWFVIFNNPENCAAACEGPDLFNPAVKGAVYYGNGIISASDGNGGGVINVDFDTVAGRIPRGMFRLDDVLPEPVFYRRGLARGNGFGAEVHMVVDEHLGPVETMLESWVPDLTTTDFPQMPVLGASNVAAAVFLPVE